MATITTPHNDHKDSGDYRDGGSAAVSIAVVFPAIALLFLALAQAVMVAAARQVALAAAEEGLRVARAHHATLDSGRTAAVAFAHQEPVLGDPQVAVAGTATITVTVRGHAPSLLPGVPMAVAATARGARERFTTDARGFMDPGGASESGQQVDADGAR